MDLNASLTLSVLTLPLAVGVGVVLGFANASAPNARQHALVLAFATALFSGLITLFLRQDEAGIGPAQLRMVAFAMLTASLAIAPLLDRARTAGLLAGGSLAALLFLYAESAWLQPHLPAISANGLLIVALLGGSLVGLLGSMALAFHPARLGALDSPRALPLPQGWLCTGSVVLALACIGMHGSENLAAIIASAGTASLLALLHARRTRHPHPFRKAGEAVLGGSIIALVGVVSLETGIITGTIAALAVAKGETMMRSLRIDDPAHMAGSVLLPAIGSLLAAGILGQGVMGEYLQWLGASLALGIFTAMLIWPFCMAMFGLAASPRRVREGLDFHL